MSYYLDWHRVPNQADDGWLEVMGVFDDPFADWPVAHLEEDFCPPEVWEAATRVWVQGRKAPGTERATAGRFQEDLQEDLKTVLEWVFWE